MTFYFLTSVSCAQRPTFEGNIASSVTPARPLKAGGCSKSQSGCFGSSRLSDGWPLAWCIAAVCFPQACTRLCLVKWPPLPVLVPGVPICCLGVNMIQCTRRRILSDGPCCPEDRNELVQGLFQPSERRDTLHSADESFSFYICTCVKIWNCSE